MFTFLQQLRLDLAHLEGKLALYETKNSDDKLIEACIKLEEARALIAQASKEADSKEA